MLIHQIWLNQKPLPTHVSRWVDKCKALGEHRLWDHDDYEKLVPRCTRLNIDRLFATNDLERTKCASDFLRLFVLLEHGGCYLDLDIEPVRPSEQIVSFLQSKPFLEVCNVIRLLPDRPRSTNGLIWTLSKADPFLKLYLDMASNILDKTCFAKKAAELSGPRLLTNLISVPNAQVKTHEYPFLALVGVNDSPPNERTMFCAHQRDWRPRNSLA